MSPTRMMSPSAKSCQTTGLVNVPVCGGGVVVPPSRTSCHCWLVPFQSAYCTTFAPSAVDAFCTSIALPLCRAMSCTYPLTSWTPSCWLVPPFWVHWITAAPSAVDRAVTSRTLPDRRDLSR